MASSSSSVSPFVPNVQVTLRYPATGEVTTYTYDDANRLLTAEDNSGVTTYTYDGNGNQLKIEEPGGDVTTNIWDGENRLVRVEHPDSTLVTYLYNADGLQVEKNDDGLVERYVYDGHNRQYETDDLSAVRVAYSYVPQDYAIVLSQRRGSDSSFYHADGTQSIRKLTDGSQVVTDEYKFDAWGNSRSTSGSTANSQQYKGELLAYRKDPDAAPDVQYALHHRNYDPKTGRFTSGDPIEDDLNLYRYVSNNPITKDDPSGLEPPVITEEVAKDGPPATLKLLAMESCVVCHNPIMLYGTHIEKEIFLQSNPEVALGAMRFGRVQNTNDLLLRMEQLHGQASTTRNVATAGGVLAAGFVSVPAVAVIYVGSSVIEFESTADPVDALRTLPPVQLVENTSTDVGTIFSSDSTVAEKGFASLDLAVNMIDVIPFLRAAKRLAPRPNSGKLFSGLPIDDGRNSAARAGKNASKAAEAAEQTVKTGDEAVAKVANIAGQYTTMIQWGIHEIDARPAGPGYWGKRIPQNNQRVEDFELKINPNNESYYLPHPEGGFVQFENLAASAVQDGKLIIQTKSLYHVDDLPAFARNKVLEEAYRQIAAAKNAGFQVEWLVSDPKAITQLEVLFKSKNIPIVITYFAE